MRLRCSSPESAEYALTLAARADGLNRAVALIESCIRDLTPNKEE